MCYLISHVSLGTGKVVHYCSFLLKLTEKLQFYNFFNRWLIISVIFQATFIGSSFLKREDLLLFFVFVFSERSEELVLSTFSQFIEVLWTKWMIDNENKH